MPGGSSTAKEEPVKVGSPPSLLEQQAVPWVVLARMTISLTLLRGLRLLCQPMPLLLKGCADGRNTVY